MATQREHFPPATYSRKGVIFPSCKECNLFAGTSFPTNFEERARHVKSKIRKKYRRQLETPDWSSSEIKELGYNLRTGVRVWQWQISIVKRRLAWNVASYLSVIDDGHYFAQADAEMHSIIAEEKRTWRNSNHGKNTALPLQPNNSKPPASSAPVEMNTPTNVTPKEKRKPAVQLELDL